jgi:hypothetical protein
MRFLMTIKPDESSRAGRPPDPRLMAALAKLGEEMTRAGVLLDTGGIQDQPLTLRASGGQLTRVDGPFAETKELIAGYAVIAAASRDEALEHAARFMRLHQEILGPSWQGETEIRQMYSMADGPPRH